MTTYERAILFQMREELTAAKEKIEQQLQELDSILNEPLPEQVTLKPALERFVQDGDRSKWQKALRES